MGEPTAKEMYEDVVFYKTLRTLCKTWRNKFELGNGRGPTKSDIAKDALISKAYELVKKIVVWKKAGKPDETKEKKIKFLQDTISKDGWKPKKRVDTPVPS